MDWIERMNLVISYIENNITCDIDYGEIARLACCPNYHFQRMFAFMADISLSEYIRRRRLTLAAFELQQSDTSVIEIAHKYGYESHPSFTRAFRELHGIAPIEARKTGAKLKAYPPMSFHILVRGGTEMDYRIEKITEFSVVGIKQQVRTEKAFSLIPSLWENIRENGMAKKLFDLADEKTGSMSGSVLGICADGNWGENEKFNYYMAVPCEKEPPEDMEKLEFPQSQWVVFEAHTLLDIIKAWKRLYTEWMPTSGYNFANLPAIERYYPPGHNPQNELWIPIVKR